jgi:hypothetical protein
MSEDDHRRDVTGAVAKIRLTIGRGRRRAAGESGAGLEWPCAVGLPGQRARGLPAFAAGKRVGAAENRWLNWASRWDSALTATDCFRMSGLVNEGLSDAKMTAQGAARWRDCWEGPRTGRGGRKCGLASKAAGDRLAKSYGARKSWNHMMFLRHAVAGHIMAQCYSRNLIRSGQGAGLWCMGSGSRAALRCREAGLRWVFTALLASLSVLRSYGDVT